MDQIKVDITAEFIEARTTVTWREIAFGLDNELLSPGAVADFATARLVSNEDSDLSIVILASLQPGERKSELIYRIAAAEPEQDSDYIQKKWLYLVLAWVFENQSAYSDPLAAADAIYADFDYPEEIVSFIRYMPMCEPDLGSYAANRARLFDNWKKYLEDAKLIYGRK